MWDVYTRLHLKKEKKFRRSFPSALPSSTTLYKAVGARWKGLARRRCLARLSDSRWSGFFLFLFLCPKLRALKERGSQRGGWRRRSRDSRAMHRLRTYLSWTWVFQNSRNHWSWWKPPSLRFHATTQIHSHRRGGNPDLHRGDRTSLHRPDPREIQISIASCSSPLSVLDEGEKLSSVGVPSTVRPSSPVYPEPSRLFCREPSRSILLGGSGNFYFQFFLSFFSTGDGSHKLRLRRRVREGGAGGEVINGEGGCYFFFLRFFWNVL